ncbi:hypothetical protein D3C77_684850 [compost metagenome]
MPLPVTRPEAGLSAVPMSLTETLPILMAITRSLLAPSMEQASLLMRPVKLILPLPPLTGPTGSSAKTLPEAAITERARAAREIFFMLMSISAG